MSMFTTSIVVNHGDEMLYGNAKNGGRCIAFRNTTTGEVSAVEFSDEETVRALMEFLEESVPAEEEQEG